MKKLKIASLLATLALTFGSYGRNIESKEIVIIDRVHKINLNLNEKSVRCSALGYGGRELKISVNDLEWISFFDHSNRGEAEPCMTAGMMSCGQDIFNFPLPGSDQNTPENQTLQRFRSLGQVESTLKQVVTERLRIDHDNLTCHRSLQETVETIVDGVNFTHFRSGDLGEYPFEICQQL